MQSGNDHPSGLRLPASRRSLLERLVRSAISLIEMLLGLAVIAAALLNFANIVGRYLLGRAIVGADEILVYLMVGVVFTGIIVVTARDAHLRMSMVIDCAPPRLRRWIRCLEWLTLAAVAGFLSWVALSISLQLQAFGQRSLLANIPMWVPHSLVSLGFAVTAGIALWMCMRGNDRVGRGDRS